jgi:hypothetical protein
MENILSLFPTWKSDSLKENRCFYFHKYIMPICIKLLRASFHRLACVVVYCSCVNPVHTKQRRTTVLNLNHNSNPHKVPNSLCKGYVYKESHTVLISVCEVWRKETFIGPCPIKLQCSLFTKRFRIRTVYRYTNIVCFVSVLLMQICHCLWLYASITSYFDMT